MNEVPIPATASGTTRLLNVPSPSCPRLLPPQAHTEVSAVLPRGRVAREKSKPAEMLVTWDRPETWIGIRLFAVVPLPSWPDWLSPQAHTVPSERSARPKSAPAAILVTPVSPVTWTGVSWCWLIVPLPISPCPLPPQAHTVPSDRRARLKSWPAATWVIPVSPATWTGVLRLVVVPSPTSPEKLKPQAQTVPPDRMARPCSNPAETCTTSPPSPLMSPYRDWPVVVPLPSSPAELSPQLATPCGRRIGGVTRAWAGPAGAAAIPATPSATVTPPASRASPRDRRQTFIVLPSTLPGRTVSGLPDRAATAPADTSGGVGAILDDALHHDGGGEPLHAGQRGELLVPQRLVGGEACGGHPDQVVRVAEQSFRVPDLRDAGQGALEFGDRGRVLAVHGHLHQHLEAEADRFRVDHGPVTADGPGALKVAQPPMTRGHAERDPLRQLGDGEPTLGLKLGKDLPVDRIHHEDYCA